MSTVTRPDARARRPPLSPARLASTAAVAVAVAVAVLVADALLAPPPYVDLTVVNPTSYDVGVVLRGADEGRRLRVGTVVANGSADFADVLDQGEEWVIAFPVEGHVAAEVRLARGELRRAGWRVEVPRVIESRLAALGIAPAP